MMRRYLAAVLLHVASCANPPFHDVGSFLVQRPRLHSLPKLQTSHSIEQPAADNLEDMPSLIAAKPVEEPPANLLKG